MEGAVAEAEMAMLPLTQRDVSHFQYTSCYCEENVYQLCKSLSEQGLAAKDASDLFVVFISNPLQQVPFWLQRNSSEKDGFCVWDYHVICIQKRSNSDESRVWDLDTGLSLPIVMSTYVARAFRPDIPLAKEYSRLFRVIKAPVFLRFFASDRRHMKSGEGWLAVPPPYDCIVAEDGEVHSLPGYRTIIEEQAQHDRETILARLQEEKFGIVVSLDSLLQLFGDSRTQKIISVREPLVVN